MWVFQSVIRVFLMFLNWIICISPRLLHIEQLRQEEVAVSWNKLAVKLRWNSFTFILRQFLSRFHFPAQCSPFSRFFFFLIAANKKAKHTSRVIAMRAREKKKKTFSNYKLKSFFSAHCPPAAFDSLFFSPFFFLLLSLVRQSESLNNFEEICREGNSGGSVLCSAAESPYTFFILIYFSKLLPFRSLLCCLCCPFSAPLIRNTATHQISFSSSLADPS